MSAVEELFARIRIGQWVQDAACRQSDDPDMFFPETKGKAASAHAKKICSRCPVIEECRQYSLASQEKHGVWGGNSERERGRILNPVEPAPKPPRTYNGYACGTENGYRSHYKAGQVPCAACRRAAARRRAEHRAKQKEKAL
jgi:WhiB family redox-sensing transcriptional regulator